MINSKLKNIEYRGKIYKDSSEIHKLNSPHFSVDAKTLRSRLFNNRYNLTDEVIDQALSKPKEEKKGGVRREIQYKGKEYSSYLDLYRRNEHHEDLTETKFSARISAGWDIEKALWTPKQKPGRPKGSKNKKVKQVDLNNVIEKKAEKYNSKIKEALKKALDEIEKKKAVEAPVESNTESKESVSVKNTASNIALNKNINSLEKRVTLYLYKADLGGSNKAIVGFTTEKVITDIEFMDCELLLKAKVSLSTAGRIQSNLLEVFKDYIDYKESVSLISSQVYNLKEQEYFNMLDYIYSLIAKYQNEQ